MRPRPGLPDGPYLVVGLARSGVAAALALHERGGEVIGVDSATPDVRDLGDAGIEVHLDSDGSDLVERAATVVKSPGVPSDVPAVALARERARTVIGELELAWRMLDNEFIAVTGTNGKTTTVELLGHIHRVAGLPVAIAGNVGRALSGLVGAVDRRATIVCETSSFQLGDTSEFAPEVAVLLNIAPDHLDRHGSLDAYIAAKLRIFARQDGGDIAVVPTDLSIDALGGDAQRVPFGDAPPAQLEHRSGWLWWRDERLLAVDELRLRGDHNRANAMAAAAAALARGVDAGAVAEGLRSFAGVAHRLEEVATVDGVLYINDSKATNVASAIVALRSFAPGSVHLIVGGQGKGESFEPLREPVARHCAAVYLVGEDGPQIGAALGGVGVEVTDCGELERAFATATRAATDGQVVLLSPACASFDQYSDFEQRGDRFRALAVALQ